MHIKSYIPNTITLMNILCGCLSVWSSFSGRLDYAGYFILAAAVFDFCDGLSARLLNAKSDIGKELDSLCDVVSFGVAPACIMFQMLQTVATYHFLPFVAFLIPMLSALRLAKFNLDERQTESFIGLPTPANAIFILALPHIAFVQNQWILTGITLLFSILLVVELPLLALKFKNLQWASNKMRFCLLIGVVVLLIVFGCMGQFFTGVAASIVYYILLSVINNMKSLKTK